MIDSISVTIDTLAQNSLNDPFLAFPVYVLAGFASSLFPCVYPLIPITVGFLQKRSEGGSRWTHPFLYWFGTILSYTALGMLAALGGGAFNTLMQNGIVITLTGFLFLFMVFAILDWHPIQFTGGNTIYQSARQKSGWTFTVMMGMGAGLIASACVAPALVTMLLFIASVAGESGGLAGAVFYGGFLSAGFGTGLGLLFFLAGVFGAKLPKSGNWMNYVKYAFALLILISAYWQIEKGFAVLGYKNMDFYIILLGLILLAAAAFLGLRPPEKGDRPALTRFLFALFLLAFGLSAVIKGVVLPSSTAVMNQPPADSLNQEQKKLSFASEEELMKAEPGIPHEFIAGIKFYRDDSFAREMARLTGRPVFIDFYADWCTNCKDFYKLLEKNPELQAALSKAVPLKIVDTDPVFTDFYAAQSEYPELSIGLPFFVILDSQGKTVWKTTNYRDTGTMTEKILSQLR